MSRSTTGVDDTAPLAEPDPRALTAWLQREAPEVRHRTMAVLSRPEFRYVDGLTRDEYRDQVLAWLRGLADEGLGSLGFPTASGGQADPAGRLASFETVAHHDLSLLVKLGVQFGLFGGAVLRLGTEQHHSRYLPSIMSAELPGCFAMTEVGHGSDVRSLRTTATYDRSTGQLTVHTPDPSARKDYIGNAARHGRLAVVFAQLRVPRGDGPGQQEFDEQESGEQEFDEHGVHAVLVPLRDEAGRLCPGVSAEDDGPKMGLNGVDNGRLSFDQVTVPREALLNRFGTLAADGTYSSPIPNSSARFFTMLGALVEGRVSVACGAASVAKSALTIAVRYAGSRRQFAGPDAPETLLLDYLTHQRRLLPALATTYSLHTALRRLGLDFIQTLDDEPGSEQSRLLEGRAAGLKAYSTWHTTATVQTCREACGGEGYLSVNRLAPMKSDSDVFTTFEGDNTVLLQLLARGLLTEYAGQFEDLNLLDMLRIGAERATALLEASPLAGGWRAGDKDQLRSVDTQLQTFRWREQHQLAGLGRRLKKRVDEGANPVEALADCQDHVLTVALAHVERLVLEQMVEAVEEADAGIRPVLDRLRQLFGAWRTWVDRGWFLEHGHLSAGASKVLGGLVNQLCEEVRPQAPALVDAFDIPDAVLAAPIATAAVR